jgi:spore coat protein CotH
MAVQDTEYLQDPDHQFWFGIDNLPTIQLNFSTPQWELLLTSTNSDREEVMADFTFTQNGIEYPVSNIGIKLSGNTSFRLPATANDPFVQANFTLDFDEFIDDQELKGIAALKLKRFNADSTFVHEPLSNQIMHNFDLWTAHSSSYVRLVLKVGDSDAEYFGVYRMNESVNRHEYIDKRFGKNNDSGFLWQGNYKAWGEAHFSRITADWDGVGDFDQASFEYKGKGSKFAEGKAQLVELAENFSQLEGSEFEEYVTQHLNIPLFLKSLAAEAVLGHWDGFWGNGNNYMFYIDEQAMLHFIPFDTDNTLGTSLIVADTGEQNPLTFGPEDTSPLLVKKILAIEQFKQEFKGYTKQLVSQDNLMDETYSLDWIASVHSLIEDHLLNVTGDNQTIADRPASWSNQADYRIFDLSSGKNWYATRKSAVLNSFEPPVANAGEDVTIEVGQSVQFDGSASTDSDGSIKEYQWSNNLSGVSPSLVFDEVGSYVITLTVVDNDDSTDSDELTVTVIAKSVVEPVSIPDTKGGGSLYLLLFLSLFFIRKSRGS